MSSTNKTPNYKLNQWVTADYVKMADFNSDNALIDTALAAKANIATGNYTGDGTGGTAARKSLDFSFAPAVVIIAGPAGSSGERHEASAVLIRNNTVAGYTVEKNGTVESISLACSWNGNSVSFYSISDGDNAASEQFNAQGESYFYIALGA